ncbi:MAG: immunoglobulin-like domain-containing protein [Bacteroidota bacterium]
MAQTNLSMLATQSPVFVGDDVSVTIQVEPTMLPTTLVEGHLSFGSSYLKVKTSEMGEFVPDISYTVNSDLTTFGDPVFDNSTGQIVYSAAVEPPGLGQPFSLLTIHFTAVAPGEANIDFVAGTNVVPDAVGTTTGTSISVLNTAPVISAIGDLTIAEAQVGASVPISITDADGDNLTVSVSSVSEEPEALQSTNATPQVDPFPTTAEGFLSETNVSMGPGTYASDLVFNPVFGDGGGADGDGSGTYTITVSVDDEDGNTVVETFTLTVNDAAQPIASNAVTRIEAESFDNQGGDGLGNDDGIGVEVNQSGVTNIGFTNNGDFAEYLVDVEAGTYTLDLKVAKNGSGTNPNVKMDINSGDASIVVLGTGGWQNYETVSAQITFLTTGEQILRFDWSGPGFLFNMDYFDVIPTDDTPPVITLNGDNPLAWFLGEPYVDPGATATDNVDGEFDLTGDDIDDSGVDVNTLGEYSVFYDVSDNAGNDAAQVVRTVNIVEMPVAPGPLDCDVAGGSTILYRINAGNPATVTPSGMNEEPWVSDANLPFRTGGNSTFGPANFTAVLDNVPADKVEGNGQSVFDQERFDNTGNGMQYALPVEQGAELKVSLLLMEGFFQNDDAREFDVMIEGVTPAEFDGLNPHKDAGGRYIGYVREYTLNAGDDILNIDFIPVKENPAIRGIQVCEVTASTLDNEKPVITLNGSSEITIPQDPLGTYVDEGATVTDNVDQGLEATPTGTVDPTTIGQYFVTYNATDAAENEADPVTRTINVTDQTAPELTLNGPALITLIVGDTYTELSASATDNVDLAVAVSIGGDVVDTDMVGTYVVTYNATDVAGNAAEQLTRTVQIEAPIVALECPDGTEVLYRIDAGGDGEASGDSEIAWGEDT